MKDKIFKTLKGGLIVSCQAKGASPFNSPEGVTLFAKAAVLGGASGIRSEGIAKTKMILENIKVPVIGLVKSEFDDGFVRITGSIKDVEDLLEIGVQIIAIDGTFRKREGKSGPDFIKMVKDKYNCIVLADIATFAEGVECLQAGTDSVSTTLSGYTPETLNLLKSGPDFNLLTEIVNVTDIPVFAEGRINSPAEAKKMMMLGAWGVIAGSAITDPAKITEWYIEAMKDSNINK